MLIEMKINWNKISSDLRAMFNVALEIAKPFSLINILFYVVILALVLMSLGFFIVFLNSNGGVEYTQFFILLTVSVTLLTLIYNIRRHVSEDYYKEAKEHLKKAFETLAPKSNEGRPKNDRFLWLTCARFLRTSERFSKRIIMSSHKDMYIEERQYWRVKFMEIIKDFPSNYYAESPEHLIMHSADVRSPIAESSLYVIYGFIQWDEKYTDPLDNHRFTDEKIRDMRIHGPRGLGDLLSEHRKLKKRG